MSGGARLPGSTVTDSSLGVIIIIYRCAMCEADSHLQDNIHKYIVFYSYISGIKYKRKVKV